MVSVNITCLHITYVPHSNNEPVYTEYTWFTPFPNKYTNIRIYPYIIQVMCFFNKHDIVMFPSTTQIYVWVVTAGMVGMQTFHRVQPQSANSRNVPGVTIMTVVYLPYQDVS